jgi:hypothetical protein
VRLCARLDGGHRGQRAEEDQRRGHRTGESNPAGQGDQAEQHAHDQERDHEVDDLRVEGGDIGHH